MRLALPLSGAAGTRAILTSVVLMLVASTGPSIAQSTPALPNQAEQPATMEGMDHSAMSTDPSQVEVSTEATHQHLPRDVSPDLPAPSVTHLVFPDAMDGYNIQILAKNFTFTPAAVNRAAQDNEGHAHLYVNGNKISRLYGNWYHLSSSLLQSGVNIVTITLNANDHSEWAVAGTPISSSVRVIRP